MGIRKKSADFNPRSPHGERPPRRKALQTLGDISIHAPRTGSDMRPAVVSLSGRKFQSTLPARGATSCGGSFIRENSHFNPRSPHGERRPRGVGERVRPHFNPRSPHGERQATSRHQPPEDGDFNPRSPHGERQRKVTILSIRIIGFAQKVYHKTVLLRISLAENAVILPKRPQNPVRTSLQKAGGLRFARAIRAARPYSISSPSGA